MWVLQFLQGKGFLLGGTVLSVLSPVISVAFMGFAKGPSPPGKQMFRRKTAVWLSDTRWGCCKGNSSLYFTALPLPQCGSCIPEEGGDRGLGHGGSPVGEGELTLQPPSRFSESLLSKPLGHFTWGPWKGVYEPVKLGLRAFVDFSGISGRNFPLIMRGFSKYLCPLKG